MAPRETLLSMGDTMMPIRFVCPQCGKSGRLPDGFQGTKIKCPACNTISRLDGDGIAGSNVAGALGARTSRPYHFLRSGSPCPAETRTRSKSRNPGQRLWLLRENFGRAANSQRSAEREPEEGESSRQAGRADRWRGGRGGRVRHGTRNVSAAALKGVADQPAVAQVRVTGVNDALAARDQAASRSTRRVAGGTRRRPGS